MQANQAPILKSLLCHDAWEKSQGPEKQDEADQGNQATHGKGLTPRKKAMMMTVWADEPCLAFSFLWFGTGTQYTYKCALAFTCYNRKSQMPFACYSHLQQPVSGSQIWYEIRTCPGAGGTNGGLIGRPVNRRLTARLKETVLSDLLCGHLIVMSHQGQVEVVATCFWLLLELTAGFFSRFYHVRVGTVLRMSTKENMLTCLCPLCDCAQGTTRKTPV